MHYFKKYLQVAPLSHALWRSLEAQSLKKLVKKGLVKPLLDLGCGFGEFAGVYFDSTVEFGLDISSNDLVLASKGKKFKKLILADARKMPFPDTSFETVVSISVLEHIKKVDLVFNEVFRVLKNGGEFIFSVPTNEINQKLLGARILKSIGLEKVAKYYLKVFHRSFSHQNVFSTDKWLRITRNSGFKIQNVSSTISSKELAIFELFLLFALQTQITKKLFGKRLLFSPRLRVAVLSKLFSSMIPNQVRENINIMVKAQKK